MAVVMFSAGKSRQVTNAQRVTAELNSIAQACVSYYTAEGSWPGNFSALQPKYLSAQVAGVNPFGNNYTISSTAAQVTVSTLLPAGLITLNSFGTQVVVTNQGSNDLVSVTKPITQHNWRLIYDKKYLYGQ